VKPILPVHSIVSSKTHCATMLAQYFAMTASLVKLRPLSFLQAALLLHLGLISVSCIYLFVHLSRLSYHVYYWPAFSTSTRLTLDLAAISILSSHVPIIHHVTYFPFLYRHSHAYISFLLMTLYDSSPLYTSHATQFSTDWRVLFSYLHVYFSATYVFISRSLTCLLILLWHVLLPYLYK
jgi:hypothetical protein